MNKMVALMLTLLLVTLGAGFATAAPAAKFFSSSATVNAAGGLVVSFDERGVGNATLNYTIMADADALYACRNNGGNFPSDPKKQSVSQTVVLNINLTPKNGRLVCNGCITLPPPPNTSLVCPGGQTAVLVSITWSNLVITDNTNAVSTNVLGGPWSRTFFII